MHEVALKQMGMHAVTIEAHRNEDVSPVPLAMTTAGIWLDLVKACATFSKAFGEWIMKVLEVTEGNSPSMDDGKPVIALTKGPGGIPILPPPIISHGRSEHLKTQREIIREFFRIHYRVACNNERAAPPWEAMGKNPEKFFWPEDIPESFVFRDPTRMSGKEVQSLLAYLRNRQENETVTSFSFRQVLQDGKDGRFIKAKYPLEAALLRTTVAPPSLSHSGESESDMDEAEELSPSNPTLTLQQDARLGGNTHPVGGNTPPVGGNTSVVGGNTPPVGGNTFTMEGNASEVGGNPAVGGNTHPVRGNTPPVGGNTSIVGGNTPPVGGNTSAMEGNASEVGGNPAVGGNTHPVRGNTPPVGGNTSIVGGNTPPVGGNTSAMEGNASEVGGNPAVGGNTHPVRGNTPPVGGNTSIVGGNTPPVGGNTSAVEGNTRPVGNPLSGPHSNLDTQSYDQGIVNRGLDSTYHNEVPLQNFVPVDDFITPTPSVDDQAPNLSSHRLLQDSQSMDILSASSPLLGNTHSNTLPPVAGISMRDDAMGRQTSNIPIGHPTGHQQYFPHPTSYHIGYPPAMGYPGYYPPAPRYYVPHTYQHPAYGWLPNSHYGIPVSRQGTDIAAGQPSRGDDSNQLEGGTLSGGDMTSQRGGETFQAENVTVGDTETPVSESGPGSESGSVNSGRRRRKKNDVVKSSRTLRSSGNTETPKEHK
ncbi:hypothetical protein JR316_0013181 [Psilocybe cubensis]|uniref:Uncharacterized protein n=1 Tax=Psilocybe cubensis TaxID=181762 RepID=A0ACB8GHM8_PSICU|nr:hypothetical protein JR316_0013181 [Psilocybe cubensis]KAH9474716.1 hypothetical protein JR316_0013181 [Psilocybe cubensis]